MAKAIFLAALSLMTLIGPVRAENLYCATMIALGRYDVPHEVITQIRSEISLNWSKATGEKLNPENLDKIIIACVDDPGKPVADVVKMLVTQDRSEGHKFALDSH